MFWKIMAVLNLFGAGLFVYMKVYELAVIAFGVFLIMLKEDKN